ncbi:MAG: hypothetical protein ACOYEP_10445, partial [Limnochordia bacterium]
MKHRKTALIVLFATAIFVSSNYCLLAQTSLFADAFDDADTGGPPAGWIIHGGVGTVEVISDPQPPSGRALRIIAPSSPDATSSHAVVARTPRWEAAPETTTVAVEFMVRWCDGSNGIYHYITKDEAHRIILPIYGGKLLYKPDGPMLTLAELNEGWNRVRVVANRESGEVFVYLNDMETPVAGPLPFRRPIDSWTGTQFIMRVEANPHEPREMLYGDVEVSVVQTTSTIPDTGTQHTTGSEDHLPRPDWKGYLRPTAGAIAAQMSMPFYQALPVRQGELYPAHIETIPGLTHGQDTLIPASLSPAALWPDGSIRWLAVDGMWPRDLTLDTELSVRVDETASADSLSGVNSRPPIKGLAVVDEEVHLVDVNERTVAVLVPVAAYTEITEPKVILPDSVPDQERQYAWAEPLEALNPQGHPQALSLRIREHVVEKENHIFTVHRLRGDAGDATPGNGLEWQLRVRIYKDVPVVRLQMSWGLHWNPQKYALTQAAWVARFATPLNAASVPGITSRIDTTSAPLVIQSDPTGHGVVRHGAADVAESEWPDAQWNVLLVETAGEQESYLGVGTPNFTRLGPNHISVDEDSVMLASWSDQSGRAFDLRLTAAADEFGMANSDVDPAGGVGVMHTLESSLVWSPSPDHARTLAYLEATRDTLWLPSQQDITATGSLGPISPDVFESNREYFTG